MEGEGIALGAPVDSLQINFVLVQPEQDSISAQVIVSRSVFEQTPRNVISEMLLQIGAMTFSPHEQSLMEESISAYAGIVRNSNLRALYVYILILGTDAQGTVLFSTPQIYLKTPSQERIEQYRRFGGKNIDLFLRNPSAFKRGVKAFHDLIRICGYRLRYRANRDSDDGDVCSICRTRFGIQKELVQLPCDHSFGVGCIISWLRLNNSCPDCRRSVVQG